MSPTNDAFPAERNAIVTIGTFDGVHRGHQTVLHAVTRWAKDESTCGGVLTFRDHPRKTLEGRAVGCVTTSFFILLCGAEPGCVGDGQS